MTIELEKVRSDSQACVSTAVLLAAGTGSRLQPLTSNAPKCLTEIGGIPILERLLSCLRLHGFKRLVVVVGHLEQSVRTFLDQHAGSMAVEYVVSPRYRTTNNIYSLWLAREVVQEPLLLIESDLVFDSLLIKEMLYPDRIAVSRSLPWMNGTTVTADASMRLKSFHLGAAANKNDIKHFKTVNIYSLSLASWRRIGERLDYYIRAGRVNEYYESVFADMVDKGSLSLECVVLDKNRWYEVDTLEDMRAAERMFPKRRVAMAPVIGGGVKAVPLYVHSSETAELAPQPVEMTAVSRRESGRRNAH